MDRVGIIPAGGLSTRWQGLPKECLPVSQGMTFLSRTVKIMQKMHCSPVVLVTTPARQPILEYVLGPWGGLEYCYDDQGMFSSWMTACREFPADEYVMMMPDTCALFTMPSRPLTHDIHIGTFMTDTPEQFGTFRDGVILDKAPSDKPEQAWGAVAWKRAVYEHWTESGVDNYSEALTEAIQNFDLTTFPLTGYYDIANFAKYKEFLNGI